MWEYADRADLAVKTPYDPEADIEWLSGCGNRIQMKPGMFYLVYPDDGTVQKTMLPRQRTDILS